MAIDQPNQCVRLVWVLLLLRPLFPAWAAEVGESIGHVEQISPQLDTLVAPDAKFELLAEGFEWSEGPVWIEDGEFLIFSDIP
ncbi:MAG: hypothetical protein AAGF97_08555, partial [Planctomycetota bacterium]